MINLRVVTEARATGEIGIVVAGVEKFPASYFQFTAEEFKTLLCGGKVQREDDNFFTSYSFDLDLEV